MLSANFAWMDQVEELSSPNLTVDIQTAPDLNTDDRLLYPVFMPRLDVPSVKISTLGGVSFRPASGRRGWNQRGVQIGVRTPDINVVEMEPTEGFFTINEREMQSLRERFNGAQQLIADQIKADVPTRTRDVASANHRSIEMDVFEAWVNGTVTVRDPQTNEPYLFSYGIDPARYETAGTPWSDPSVNAFDEFIAWLGDATKSVGTLAGAALCQRVLKHILKDAPTLAGGEKMSLAQLAGRVSADIDSPFRFYSMDTLPDIDVPIGGGPATRPAQRWPDAAKIAAVPADQRVGRTGWAPVGRAMDVAQQVPDAKIDVNGMAAFPATANNGRELTVEVQANVIPLPNAKRVAIFNTRIAA